MYRSEISLCTSHGCLFILLLQENLQQIIIKGFINDRPITTFYTFLSYYECENQAPHIKRHAIITNKLHSSIPNIFNIIKLMSLFFWLNAIISGNTGSDLKQYFSNRQPSYRGRL